jgi:predicted LPLAT superfamily acyltransferase
MTPVTSQDDAQVVATAPQWTVRSERGSQAMLRLMTALSLRLGRRASRRVLPLINLYYTLFGGAARRASRQYLRRALGREPLFRDGLRHVGAFATTIHDRLFLLHDRFDLFDIEIEGGQLVSEALASGAGAFLMGAHFGSFEILRAVGRHHLTRPVVMVMYERNARKVNAALASVNPTAVPEIIALGHPDSMLKVQERLEAGAIVGMLVDRAIGADTIEEVPFLGLPAPFPTGPFRMAAALRRPVFFMAGAYLGDNRYRVRFMPLADFSVVAARGRTAAVSEAVRRFAALVEAECRCAPYNWFNFYDFWNPVAGDTEA